MAVVKNLFGGLRIRGFECVLGAVMKKSKIVKQNDHLMDATRYLILSGLQVACREPREEAADERHWIDSTRSDVSVWRRGPHQSSIPARRLGTLYSGIETDQFPHQSTT